MSVLDPDLLIRAYAVGVFPMADSRDAPDVFWVEPKRRGILPLNAFHLPRSLAKLIRAERFEVSVNTAFAEVMEACAAPQPDRPETWINDLILENYQALYERGHAHSVECWLDGVLAGGLYGVHINGAFFGESMFTRVRDASKVALAHLVARLRVGGFRLLDTQFLTDHLARFGAVEVDRSAYQSALSVALSVSGDFFALDREPPFDGAEATMVSGPTSGKRIVQLLTQTS